jgi:hypothetical protein
LRSHDCHLRNPRPHYCQDHTQTTPGPRGAHGGTPSSCGPDTILHRPAMQDITARGRLQAGNQKPFLLYYL